jgi:hypothetical protein
MLPSARPAYLLLAALYLLARVPALLSVPLFHDESEYLLRGKVFPELLWLTWIQGKIGYELLLAAAMRLPLDSLLLIRLLSVGVGLGTLYGILLIARELKNPAAGIVAGLLYAGAPLAVLHERLGLSDSLLTCLACFVLLASVRFALAPEATRQQGMRIGELIVVAVLAKLSGILLLYLPMVVLGVLDPPRRERWRKLRLLCALMLLVFLAVAALVSLRYGSYELSKTSATSLGARLQRQQYYAGLVASWLVAYLPAPLLLCCGANARYLWGHAGRARLLVRVLVVSALSAAMIWNGVFAVRLILNPLQAPLVPLDREQYLETWTAGYHIPELITLLEQKADEQGPIIVANQNRLRLINLAPQLYLGDNPKVRIEPIELSSAETPQQLRELAAQRPTYIVLDEDELQGYDFVRRYSGVRLVRVFMNPLGTMRFYVYEQPGSAGANP